MRPDNANERVLYVLCGLSGAGKTTLAEEKVRVNADAGVKTTRVSTNDWFKRSDGSWVFEEDRLHEYHQLAFNEVVAAMEADDPVVIVDNTNIYHKHRRPYIVEGLRLGYRVECVIVGDFNEDFARFCASRTLHLTGMDAVGYNMTMARRFEVPDRRFITKIDKTRLGWTPGWEAK